ncbi:MULTISPECIES: tetratricopeptide repeat protein [Niastella]|uniref:Tetratricopeptide repeat protein n=1 Tax=Niastella soli TaxID=2821487 RepID=A0ABS3YLV7_9BACT|nr:tetratricopeptide repeat protein [Niastella soli]MBO9198863.1 tetratricopeptide repeat protein [Niastella soli]
MPKQILLCLLVLLAGQSFAQNYKGAFNRLLKEKDTAAQRQLLQTWQQAAPTDAELFVAYFNYYFRASRQEIVHLSEGDNGNPSLALTDSTGSPVGFLSEDFGYDSALLERAFHYINKGISNYTTRLDMRFGKIYALGQIENYESFTNEIITAIELSNKLKSQWAWADNKKLENPETFFLGAIQDYVVQLYNAGDDQLNRMRRIAQTVLKYYPKHVESLSNLAITYGLQGNYDKALESLLQAEKIMPRDVIVLNNIATMYERKGDKTNAIKYFELTAKLGDKETRNAAVEKLKELKN